LYQARNIYEQVLEFSKLHTGRSDMPFNGYVYVGLGRILCQWNELDNAYNYATKGIALCKKWNVAEVLALSNIELAYIHYALGNDEQVDEALHKAKQIFDGFSPWGSDIVTAHKAKFDLARGDVKSAERWARANNLNLDNELDPRREIEYLTRARVFIAQNGFEEAMSILRRLHQFAQGTGKRQTELETLILQGLALFAKGQTEQALVYLEQAFVIGEPENYVRIFVDEGLAMARLLYKALEAKIFPEYTSRLLAAFPTSERMSPPLKAQTDLVEPLSLRELEVLSQLSEGFTNQEVALALHIAVGTVKNHVKNIYSKLNVHSRTQAAARARDLGLLD
jgi:LuxR family maltose regulon positive regulatory protein